MEPSGGGNPSGACAPLQALITGKKYKSFGIEYKHIKTRHGGDLYLTGYGAPFLRQLLPENWYDHDLYANLGQRLPGTSAVYKMATIPSGGKSIDIVIKFCRIGKEVAPYLTQRAQFISNEDFASARWNGPFEEFGRLMELRRGVYGTRRRFLTQRPLGIFMPPDVCQDWQLGRSPDSFRISQSLMDEDPTISDDDDPVELDISRHYILIYSWIKGVGLDELLQRGFYDEARCNEITSGVYFNDLIPSGFKVLDTKYAHIILRPDSGGKLVRRHGSLSYALIDYELLRRTPEYEKSFIIERRRQYWNYIYERYNPESLTGIQDDLKTSEINGVPYIFGPTPNGGKLWVLGYNHRLFDYFLPEKWRNRDRIRLSSKNEVYHSITPDNIHLVYKRSRVGVMSETNPLEEKPQAIAEYGYNSPFEEVAIAEHLRRNGVRTAHPRAIYRTGRKSTMVKFFLDERRYLAMKDMLTPEDKPERVLSDQHDYYVLWGCWRGIDPERGFHPGTSHWGLTTINQALTDRLISAEEAAAIVNKTFERLRRRNIASLFIPKYDYVLAFNDDMSTLQREPGGDYKVTLAIDAHQAFYWKLIDAVQYRTILQETADELRNLGYEMLNLAGDHLLLSSTPEGVLMKDPKGRIKRSISNFELMKKI